MIWSKYMAVAAASMLKFVGGPLAGLALGLPWFTTALCAATGMMSSVVLTLVFSKIGQQLLSRYRANRPQKLFSKRTRWAVKVWQRAGIHGICVLTPILFTPIGGTLLALSFKVQRGTILVLMLGYALFWGAVLSWAASQLAFVRSYF